MYCYFKGEVDYCCDSCYNCEHYEEDNETSSINDDIANEEDDDDMDCEFESDDDLVSRESLLNAIYDFIEKHRYDGRVSWDGANWLLISDDVKEIIRETK